MAPAARELAALALCLVQTACVGGPLRLDPPDVNPAMIPPIAARAPVAVRAEPSGDASYPISSGTGERVDDDDVTRVLAASVTRALEALGVRVEPQAARSIQLSVTHVGARLAGMHFECSVDFNRQLGSGPAEGLQARGVDRDVHEACSFAVKEAATTVLADGAVRRYLETP
jgi:hypothetical protein